MRAQDELSNHTLLQEERQVPFRIHTSTSGSHRVDDQKLRAGAREHVGGRVLRVPVEDGHEVRVRIDAHVLDRQARVLERVDLLGMWYNSQLQRGPGATQLY